MAQLLDDGDRRIALATASVGVASFASLGLLYTVGEPFGTLNDIGNAAVGILGASLAVRTRHRPKWRPATRVVATCAAVVGAGVVTLGSGLVISRATGWFLAGHVSTLGFACLGVWLVALGGAVRDGELLPRRAANLARLAGALMLAGFVSIPAITARYDDIGTAPAWVYIFSFAWLGILLFLAWCGWVGRQSAPSAAMPPGIAS